MEWISHRSDTYAGLSLSVVLPQGAYSFARLFKAMSFFLSRKPPACSFGRPLSCVRRAKDLIGLYYETDVKPCCYAGAI